MSKGTIITKQGTKIPLLELTPNKLLDRTICLYGRSNSGKSVFIKYIMKILKDYIPVSFVVSPTEPSNRSYEKFIDKSLIHYDLTIEKGKESFLDKFWDWCSIRSSIYHKVNNKTSLMSLYDRIKSPEIDKLIQKIERKKEDDLNNSPSLKHDEIEKNYNELLIKLIKKHIMQYKHILKRQNNNLNEDEKYSLTYIDLNPRVLLIFDDCASELKSYFNKPIFRKIFYQSRHSFITSIFAIQDDTDISANLRKNVALSIFMTSAVSKSNFERASNKFSKDLQKIASNIYDEIFIGHRKLVFIDNDPNRQFFYHITAELVEPFKFGSNSLHNICQNVESAEGTIDKQNIFYQKFKI